MRAFTRCATLGKRLPAWRKDARMMLWRYACARQERQDIKHLLMRYVKSERGEARSFDFLLLTPHADAACVGASFLP